MFNRYFNEINVEDNWQSRGRTITETDLVMFSALSGDWYPLHSDQEWAAKSQFKQRIAHGMLLLSVATGLFELTPGVVAAFYGMDQVRFVKPVFIGDTISVSLAVISKNEHSTEQGVVNCKMEIKKNTGETAVVAEVKFLINSCVC